MTLTQWLLIVLICVVILDVFITISVDRRIYKMQKDLKTFDEKTLDQLKDLH